MKKPEYLQFIDEEIELEKFFPEKFMREYTDMRDAGELMTLVRVWATTLEEFLESYDADMDGIIRAHTEFDDGEEMLRAAADYYLAYL